MRHGVLRRVEGFWNSVTSQEPRNNHSTVFKLPELVVIILKLWDIPPLQCRAFLFDIRFIRVSSLCIHLDRLTAGPLGGDHAMKHSVRQEARASLHKHRLGMVISCRCRAHTNKCKFETHCEEL